MLSFDGERSHPGNCSVCATSPLAAQAHGRLIAVMPEPWVLQSVCCRLPDRPEKLKLPSQDPLREK
jgi:hypothetical protein